VIRYPEIVESVAERTRLGEPDDVKSAIKAVLAGVAHWVGVPEREAIAQVLPTELRYVVESPRPTVGGDLGRFLQFVAFVVDTTPERARYYSQAVISFLCTAEPSLAGTLRRALPHEFAVLFEPPRDADRPAAPAAAATPAAAAAPAELSAEELTGVLTRLPGWRGNTRRLTRTVTLPPGADPTVVEAIHRAEDQLNHHAQLRRDDGDLTLTLWTHSRDVVTDLDIRLAERINDILARL
jgi:pterin-4a-carbinolamine dehydratase/uncharacterized protein (DUF2267 family)